MTKRFRPWDPKQKWLLPPEITEFIPEGHPAHFVRDLVVEQLDLSAILDTSDEDRGFPPFHPAMMVALLLYAYTQGVFSSRKIAKACIERMDFAAVTGFQKPDFRTIGVFRRRHLQALAGLFQQVLVLCRQAGLVALGHVALDGTKVKANWQAGFDEILLPGERSGRTEIARRKSGIPIPAMLWGALEAIAKTHAIEMPSRFGK